jgi:branched-chain amino acid transport system permease protein
MLAVRSNERSAAAVGISPARIKLITFAIATVIMALAGIMYSYNFSGLDPTRFTVFNTLSLVAFAYLGGITTVRGALTGGFIITQGLASYALNHYLGISVTFQLILAGILLIVTIIMNPDGIALAPPPKWPGRLASRIRDRSGARREVPDTVGSVPPQVAGADAPNDDRSKQSSATAAVAVHSDASKPQGSAR